MSKSSRTMFGGRRNGTVTVLEARVHHSFARNAKRGLVITWFVVGLLTMAVTADQLHPIVAAFAGILAGALAGAVVWALIRIWPLIRLIWWWLPEITLAVGAVYGWTLLARHTPLPARLAILTVAVGVPAAIPAIRRRLVALLWCLIVRHRLRVCFAQFIIANQSGTLPLILLARPTLVGERVWIWLRPGLSLTDLESRLDKIAVACYASTVTVTRASTPNAARIRIDVKRREVLTGTIASPLVDLVNQNDQDDRSPTPLRTVGDVPTALDLPDVAAPTTSGKPTSNGKPAISNGGRTAVNGTSVTPTPAAPAVTGPDGEDLGDWI